jgi:hypothetical protein
VLSGWSFGAEESDDVFTIPSKKRTPAIEFRKGFLFFSNMLNLLSLLIAICFGANLNEFGFSYG